MSKQVLTITQKNVDGVDVKIGLVDGQELRIERKGLLSTHEFRINILAMTDKSQRKVTYGWKWFLAGVVACLLLLPKMMHVSIIPGIYLDVIFYAGLIVCIYCFFMVWETTKIRQLFYSSTTNIPFFEMAVGNPSKNEYFTFVKKLEESIQHCQKNSDVTADKKIKGEIKTLRRLSEQGVVSVQAYEHAKSLLLKQL